MIKNIAVGSLRNKLIFILPAILLLSEFLPWLLTPLLMVGGVYLSYEGAEAVGEGFATSGRHRRSRRHVRNRSREGDDGSAIRTDFILSAEIMVIALNEVTHEPLGWRAFILGIVGLLITVGVYGVVALIVKMDDIGCARARRGIPGSLRGGPGEGHAHLVGGAVECRDDRHAVGRRAHPAGRGGRVGLASPYGFVHHLEEGVAHATGAFGGFLGWLTNTFFSFLVGLAVGAIVVAVMHLIPRKQTTGH